MPRVVHFDVHAEDPERAMRFYSEVLGWSFQPYMSDYWGIITGEDGTSSGMNGINGGLTKRQGPPPTLGQPLSAFPCTVDVDDVDAYVAKVLAAGGTVAVPKHAIEGMAWLAYCIDTEGNIFGMFQEDATAK
ncbi:MAG: VOC family protein [Chloroflexota bacterium]